MASYQNVAPKDKPAPRREIDGASRQLNSCPGSGIFCLLYCSHAFSLGVGLNEAAKEMSTGMNQTAKEISTGMNQTAKEISTGMNQTAKEISTGMNQTAKEISTSIERTSNELLGDEFSPSHVDSQSTYEQPIKSALEAKFD